ncbi:unnamed protein product [Rhizophagus irregularis]|nr:unnamed protein product [Rhizophagus irregularis]
MLIWKARIGEPSSPKADQDKMFQTLKNYINLKKASEEGRKEVFLDFEEYSYIEDSDERKSFIKDLIGSFNLNDFYKRNCFFIAQIVGTKFIWAGKEYFGRLWIKPTSK